MGRGPGSDLAGPAQISPLPSIPTALPPSPGGHGFMDQTSPGLRGRSPPRPPCWPLSSDRLNKVPPLADLREGSHPSAPPSTLCKPECPRQGSPGDLLCLSTMERKDSATDISVILILPFERMNQVSSRFLSLMVCGSFFGGRMRWKCEWAGMEGSGVAMGVPCLLF